MFSFDKCQTREMKRKTEGAMKMIVMTTKETATRSDAALLGSMGKR
jgi:hypothetical protein